MTIAVTENNYLLDSPMFFELKEHRKMYRDEPEAVFNDLTPEFWFDHFNAKSVEELRTNVKQLDLKAGATKNQMVAKLSKYFHNLVTNGDAA